VHLQTDCSQISWLPSLNPKHSYLTNVRSSYSLIHLTTTHLTNIFPSFRTGITVNLVVEFFLEKLADDPSIVVEALAGLRSLSKSDIFQAEHAIKTCKAYALSTVATFLRDRQVPLTFSLLSQPLPTPHNSRS
jgi:hypothetical protein